MKEEKELDKPYKIRSGFEGTQPGLSKRQMLSIMKTLQKIKPIKKAKGGVVKMNMGGVMPGRGGSFKGVR